MSGSRPDVVSDGSISGDLKPSQISPSVNVLKILAIVTMTIDHIGFFLFPNVLVFRIIGRLAMPIFVFLTAETVRRGKNVLGYFWRLIALAIFAQVVLYFAIGINHFNIVFNLAGLVVLLAGSTWAKLLLIPFYVFCDIEYGWLVLALGATFYYVKNQFLALIILSVSLAVDSVLNIFQSNAQSYIALIQPFAQLSLLAIFLTEKFNNWLRQHRLFMFKMPRYFFYLYYPSHQVVLALVYKLLN